MFLDGIRVASIAISLGLFFELASMRDGKQFGGLLIRHVDDFDGMVVETSDTSGLDAFVAVDDCPVFADDREALGVLVAVAGSNDIILWLEIQIVVGERLEFVDIPPFDPFLWFR